MSWRHHNFFFLLLLWNHRFSYRATHFFNFILIIDTMTKQSIHRECYKRMKIYTLKGVQKACEWKHKSSKYRVNIAVSATELVREVDKFDETFSTHFNGTRIFIRSPYELFNSLILNASHDYNIVKLHY